MRKFQVSFALYLAAGLMILVLIVGALTDNDTVIANLMWLLFVLAAISITLHVFLVRSRSTVEPTPLIDSINENAVVLILGPYAAKWFGQSDTMKQVSFSDSVTWILIRTPEALEERLNYFQKQEPKARLSALFPFLPDGHDTTALMAELIAAWQQRFSDIAATFSLPCTFAVYTRLSVTPLSEEKANWSSQMDLAQRNMSFHDALSSLELFLDSQPRRSQALIQRTLLGQQLISWFRQSELAEQFEKLFSHSRLKLNGILLCDYHQGFTRHGAWSRWAEEHFAVLPSLASSASPLPRPPLRDVGQNHEPAYPSAIPAVGRPYPKFLWSVILATVVLGLNMFQTTRLLERQQEAYFDNSVTFMSGLDLTLSRLNQRLEQLRTSREQFAKCAGYQSLRFWGFSVCTHQLSLIDESIVRLETLPRLTTAEQPVLFASGSAVLNPSTEAVLKQIKALASRFPKHTILIVGHTDNSGNEERNKSLSLQRAVSVRDWLLTHTTLTPERLATHGVGATEPVASNLTAEGREQNRRIEVLMLPSSQVLEIIE